METAEVRQSIEGHFAIKTTRFFMRMIGMWYVESNRDKILGNIGLTFAVLLMTTVGIAQSTDFYYRLNNLQELTAAMPAIAVGLSELFKFIGFLLQRRRIIDLNAYTENTFWKIEYSVNDLKVLNNCNQLIMSFYPPFIVILYLVPLQYMIIPIREYIITNGSVKLLPFSLYFGVNWTKTPVYQIAYVEEIFAAYGVSVCAMVTTSFLFTINIYAAGQFKLLQHQFSSFVSWDSIHQKLKECIKKHQLLLNYIAEIEDLYCYIILCEAFGVVVSMCFSAFGIIMNSKSYHIIILNSQLVIGCAIQLFLFSLSCNLIIEESAGVLEATYRANWYNVMHTTEGKGICRSLEIVMSRTSRPCVLTIGKFTPMSLTSFASILKTALSYFTVLQTMSET